MLGLICKSFEGFVRDQHGDAAWSRIRVAAGLSFDRFEVLRNYDTAVLAKVTRATVAELGRPHTAVLEDIGHWICTHPPLEPIRRLIRFSGTDFVDLLYALDEMHDRTRIAWPGLQMAEFRTTQQGPGDFSVACHSGIPGAAAVLTGVLRAMADDYGTLAIIESDRADGDGVERVTVRVFDQTFQAPREFNLGTVA